MEKERKPYKCNVYPIVAFNCRAYSALAWRAGYFLAKLWSCVGRVKASAERFLDICDGGGVAEAPDKYTWFVFEAIGESLVMNTCERGWSSSEIGSNAGEARFICLVELCRERGK
ncbi:hypothetical protein LINPERPRIM_LOCUS26101 [Linum perenne]